MRNYKRLDVVAFGKHLLTSGDLDPVYIALPKAIKDEKQLHRWLIAYWCYYHCGFASWASEQEGNDFWKALNTAAYNEVPAPTGERFPRGSERRHARGEQGKRMVRDLHARYGSNPSGMIDHIVAGAPVYKTVADRAQDHTLFGPWISFKICDMVDRVLNVKVDFTEAEIFMFDDPVKAALILWRQYLQLPATAKPKDQAAAIKSVVNQLRKDFVGFQAPPFNDRPVDLQEIETILCKYKSHLNGHYPLNNDITEISEALLEWSPFCSTAMDMYHSMPVELHYA